MSDSTKTGANTTESPLLSVVIPAYNAAAHICRTLDSVFAQTFFDFEVILVNDGSPDTESLEQAMQPYRSRIRYFRQDNRGPSSARNLGILKARGKFIALLDSDDLWLPHHLARQLEILQQNPELGLVYSNAIHLKENRPVGVAFDSVSQSGEPTLDALLAEQCTVNTSSVVARRDLLLEAGLFDESMNRCEDFDLWLRLASEGVRMDYDREIQVCHRLGEGLTADRTSMKQGRMQAYRKMAGRSGLQLAQRSLIEKKLSALEWEIQTELTKRSLLAGQYEEALSAASKANSLASSVKLRMTLFGVRYFPGLLRRIYTVYLQILRSYHTAKNSDSIKEIQIGGKRVNLESLIRPLLSPQR